MARNRWPTKSKGTFYTGYTGNEGPRPSERDPQKISRPSHTRETPRGRMVYQRDQGLTADNMRKPFG